MSAEKYAQWIIDNQDKKGTPDFETVAQAYRAARSEEDAPAQPTLRQKVISSAPARALQGARDPIDAAAQLLPRGLEFLSSAGGLAPNPVSEFFGSEAGRVDKGIGQYERELEQARKSTGQEGFDFARFGGNVFSPANLAIAAKFPVAATTGARVMQGGALGGVGGLLSPVNTEQNPDFMATKLGQTVLGAAAGGVATPIAGKIGDYVANKISQTAKPSNANLIAAVKDYARDSGMNWDSMPTQQQNDLVQRAAQSLKGNPAAAMRAQDFEALKMPYLTGQVTRDPAQFALERNLSQTSDPLTARLAEQARILREQFGSLSKGASSQQEGGSIISGALRGIDEDMSANIGRQYQAARASAGKDAEIPLRGLSQDLADVLQKYSDTTVRSLPLKSFEQYGLLGGQQKKVFTVESGDKLLKDINANVANDRAVNSALSELRNSVKRAMGQDAGVDDVFAPARSAAAQRFKLQEAVPALEAAASGSNPDVFVQKFILDKQASTQNVKELANLLKMKPDALNEAKAQIGAYLQRKAFGENPAGDAKINPAALSGALREIGDEKIAAFFGKQGLDQFKTMARVGGYIESFPAGRLPNTSGNWGAINKIAQFVPGMPSAVAVGSAASDALKRQLAAQAALSQKIPANPTPEQVRYLSQLLSTGALGVGSTQGQKLNQP
jgi:hypothetical protein